MQNAIEAHNYYSMEPRIQKIIVQKYAPLFVNKFTMTMCNKWPTGGFSTGSLLRCKFSEGIGKLL